MEETKNGRVTLYSVIYPDNVELPKCIMWFSTWTRATEFALANNGGRPFARTYSPERAKEIEEYAIGYGEWGG